MVKHLFLFLLISFMYAILPSVGFSQQTAYQALRVLANQRDQTLLNRVLQISGTKGATQPSIWKITVNDPSSRGGVREFEVSNGQILSERAPLRILGSNNPQFPIAARSLNVDSDSAFSIANQYARQQRIGFDTVDYALRADDSSGYPLWAISLTDTRGASVGLLKISGSDGRIIRSEGFSVQNPNRDAAWLQEGYDAPENDGGFLGRTSRTAKKVGDSTRRGTLRVLGGFQEWLTGRRTIDRDVD